MSTMRRTKWHPPPPPTPKILHLPLRIALHSSRGASQSIPKRTGPQSNLRSLLEVEKGILRKERDILRLEKDAASRKFKMSRERKKIDGSDIIERKMRELKVRSRTEVDEEADSASAKREEENVEILKKKMEGLSKGMMERMEEYLLSVSANGYSKKRIVAEMNKVKQARETGSQCCCSCKEVLGRIAEQVKTESEQWSEMQKMLDQVKLEMEHLRSSRDNWHRRAVASDLNFRVLRPHMVEWKRRAEASEQKVIELQKHIFQLENSLRAEDINTATTTSLQNVRRCDDIRNEMKLPKIKCQQLEQRSPDDCSATEKEKHVLICRLKSSHNKGKRLPLKEIGNVH